MLVLLAMFATMVFCGTVDTGHAGIESDSFRASMSCVYPDDDEDVDDDETEGEAFEDAHESAENAGTK